ncbi:MAG: DEAD/DEAH box helicase [Alphaproteobacteria bacterium]|nr:DEAD/DEAH box helicase [Alphaproteobacteria bacterium]
MGQARQDWRKVSSPAFTIVAALRFPPASPFPDHTPLTTPSPFAAVHPALAEALAARGFEGLTAVQEAVATPDAEGVDLLVSAQTGSGKTVAFGLALAPALMGENATLPPCDAPLALVIAPTRELAVQVRGELGWLYAPAGGRIASCVGGMDMRDERRALSQGAHIVVGTPGRVADHIRRGSLQMDALRAVVLDEADEMLNLGFREELEFILEAAPAGRRTLMFSATMPRGIEALAAAYQRDARRVNTLAGRRQHADIEYHALTAAAHEVEGAIFNVLRYHAPASAIVFCATRAAVTRLASRFGNRGLSVVALSGELTQTERTRALQAMRDHRAQVCVATDVAARGIDLPDLDLVIHADLPRNTEALLHRSGRTGRAGRKGASVLIVPYSARRRTERLLRDAGVAAAWGEPPSAEAIRRRDDARLLEDPALEVAPTEAEREIIAALLERHGPAHIAAAFVRLARRGQAPAEDLAPVQDIRETRREPGSPRPERPERAERARAHADDGAPFTGGAWVALSVGRAQSAEPRWLIPMLCKTGGLTKRQLGAIRIHKSETHVEIDAAAIDDFFARVGEGGRLEKSIFVRRLDEAPAAAPAPPRREKREAYAAATAAAAPHPKQRGGPGAGKAAYKPTGKAAAVGPKPKKKKKQAGGWSPED